MTERSLLEMLRTLGISKAPDEAPDDSQCALTEHSTILNVPPSYMQSLKMLDMNSSQSAVDVAYNGWSFGHCRKKYSHLLENPPCICGENGDSTQKKERVSFLKDAFKEIGHDHRKTTEPVERLQLEELEQQVVSTVQPVLLEKHNGVVRAADHASHRNTLPNLAPISCHQMLAIAQNADRVLDAWTPGDGAGDPFQNGCDEMERLVNLIYQEQVLYNSIFYETIRHCTVHCAERGQLLSDIRQRYVSLLYQIPRNVMDVYNEMLVQRSVERRLVEHLTAYKTWWQATRFKFDAIKQTEVFAESSKKCPEDSIFVLDENSNLFKEYWNLYATQRLALQLDQEDVNEERKLWQDLARILCMQLLDASGCSEFRQLFKAQETWQENARNAYQLIATADHKETSSLRDLAKQTLTNLSQLENRLVENEMEVMRVLRRMGDELLDNVHRYMNREGPNDTEMIEEVRKSLRKWVHDLNELLSQFQADDPNTNVDFAHKIHVEFEKLVIHTIIALNCRYQMARNMGINGKPDDTHLIFLACCSFPNHSRHSEIVLDSPILDFTSPETLQLSDDEFANSTQVFFGLLRGNKGNKIELQLLRHSHIYAELFRLWQRFADLHPTFRQRIFGNDRFSSHLIDLEHKMEQAVLMASDLSYFTGPEPGRFYGIAYGFIDEIQRIVTTIKQNFNINPAFSRSKDNVLRDLVNNMGTWFLFCESNLQAMTQNIAEKIDSFSDQMLRFTISIMATILPDQVFDEERYLQLYKRQANLTIKDRLESINVCFSAIAREGVAFSQVLDDQFTLHQPEKQEMTDITSQMSLWSTTASSLLELTFENHKLSREDDPVTPLLRHLIISEELRGCAERTNHQFDIDELTNLIDRNVDRKDFVEIPVSGDEINIYIKPFSIATKENINRVQDHFTIDYNKRLQREIDQQNIVNEEVQQKARNLEHAVKAAKVSNQQLEKDISVLRASQGNRKEVDPNHAEISMEHMKLLLATELPRFAQPGIVQNVGEQASLPDWLNLVHADVPDTVYGTIQTKPKYDFLASMKSLWKSLVDPREKLATIQSQLEPLLSPDEEKHKLIRQRRMERELQKSERHKPPEKPSGNKN